MIATDRESCVDFDQPLSGGVCVKQQFKDREKFALHNINTDCALGF